MKRTSTMIAFLTATTLVGARYAWAGQAPGAANAPDIAISHKDRFYTSDQFSNTISVIDPVDNKLLGVLRLGDAHACQSQPALQGAIAGAWHGLFSGPSHARDRLYRLQLRDLYRYRNERDQACHLCRPLAA